MICMSWGRVLKCEFPFSNHFWSEPFKSQPHRSGPFLSRFIFASLLIQALLASFLLSNCLNLFFVSVTCSHAGWENVTHDVYPNPHSLIPVPPGLAAAQKLPELKVYWTVFNFHQNSCRRESPECSVLHQCTLAGILHYHSLGSHSFLSLAPSTSENFWKPILKISSH